MSARAGVSPRCSSSFYGGRRIPRCHNKTLAAASLAGERESYRGREEREGAAHAFAAELISESMSLLLALPPPPCLPSSSISLLLWPHRFLFGAAHSCTRATRLLQPHAQPSTPPPTHPLPPGVFSKFLTPPLLSCCPLSCNHISKPEETSRVTVTLWLYIWGNNVFPLATLFIHSFMFIYLLF